MPSQDTLLQELLNKASFIRWLNDKSGRAEKEKWDQWEKENKIHRGIAKKAKKIIDMPFSEDISTEKMTELHRLMGSIKENRSGKE